MGGRGASSSGGSAFGKRGKANTPNEAVINTNPNYNKGIEYQINCQRCVYAYELRRRGYDVEALPHTMKQNDPMMNRISMWGHGFIGQQWEDNLGKRNKEVEQSIVSKMQQWGDGARAIVYVAWKQGGAHVFNIENHKGKVAAFDAQKGIELKLNDSISKAKPSATMISRVDNLKPNNKVMHYAVKKKGRN